MKKILFLLVFIGFAFTASAFNDCPDDKNPIERHDFVKQDQNLVIDVQFGTASAEEFATVSINSSAIIHSAHDRAFLKSYNLDDTAVYLPDIANQSAKSSKFYKTLFRFTFWNGNYLSC